MISVFQIIGDQSYARTALQATTDLIDLTIILPLESQNKYQPSSKSNIKYIFADIHGETLREQIDSSCQIIKSHNPKPDVIISPSLFIDDCQIIRRHFQKAKLYYISHGLHRAAIISYKKRIDPSIRIFVGDQVGYLIFTRTFRLKQAIQIHGLPQFNYLKLMDFPSRDEICYKHKLDPTTKIIFIIPNLVRYKSPLHIDHLMRTITTINQSIDQPCYFLIKNKTDIGVDQIPRQDNLIFLDSKDMIYDYLKASDIIICHGMGTSFLESLMVNPKTILFYTIMNKKFEYYLRDDNYPHYQKDCPKLLTIEFHEKNPVSKLKKHLKLLEDTDHASYHEYLKKIQDYEKYLLGGPLKDSSLEICQYISNHLLRKSSS